MCCFPPGSENASELESHIAAHLEDSLKYHVDTFVAHCGRGVVDKQITRVFRRKVQEGITIHVGFLQKSLPPEIAEEVCCGAYPEDELRVIDREYYWLCRIKNSRLEGLGLARDETAPPADFDDEKSNQHQKIGRNAPGKER